MIARNFNSKFLITSLLLLTMLGFSLMIQTPMRTAQAKVQWSHRTHEAIAENANDGILIGIQLDNAVQRDINPTR